MNKKFLTVAASFVFFITNCYSSNDLLTVKVNTTSNKEIVTSGYTVEKWDKHTKVISITITNKGNNTEVIKNIIVHFDKTPQFNSDSKFLYGGYDMGQTPTNSAMCL